MINNRSQVPKAKEDNKSDLWKSGYVPGGRGKEGKHK